MATIAVTLIVFGLAPMRAWAQTDETPAEEPSSDARLDVLGTLRRFPADLEALLGMQPKQDLSNDAEKYTGWPFFDGLNRKMFQLYEVEEGGVAILVRDLNSFSRVKTIVMPEYRALTWPTFPTKAPDGSIEIDEEGKRLFLFVNGWDGQDTPGLVVVDWDRAEPRYGFTPIPLPEGSATAPSDVNRPTFLGITYVPEGRKIYLRYDSDSTNAEPFNVATVTQLDVGQSDALAVKVGWSRWIRACRAASTFGNDRRNGDIPVLYTKTDSSLYVPCNPGAATAVVRVPLSEAGMPITEEVFTGIGFGLHYLVDPAGNRIHIKTTSGPTGPAVLTFDADKRAYVGLSALQDPDPNSTIPAALGHPMSVDPTSGRVYALSDQKRYGLTMFDGRLSPVPPGRQFPQVRHKSFTNTIPPAIRFDARTRRIFVPRPGDGVTGDFLILRDDAPTPEAPEIDVDTLTSDITDDEGVTTQADYSGGASAYGLRVLLAGGVRGLPHVSPFEGTPSDLGTSDCRAIDRDLIFGRTERTFLQTAGRTASSIAGDTDLTTRADLAEPSRCREQRRPDVGNLGPIEPIVDGDNGKALWGALTNPAYDASNGAAQPWPFRRTECPVPNADGTTREKDVANGGAPFGGSQSAVDCVPTKAQVLGSAVSRLPLPAGPVSFGDAASFTEVVRDPKRGLVSRAVAYVRDLDIAGVVQIDGVYAIAESFATGRPEQSNKIGAGTRYIRSVTGFTSPGYSCGHDGEDPCGDPSALVDGMNRALGSFGVQLRFPPLEPKLAEGTPGGYQAGVQREFFNSLNAEFSNGDILKEVPALEVVRTNDSKNWGRQRQIYQFAGVLANSQYGVRALGSVVPPPPPVEGSTDPVPPEAQVLGDVVDGLARPQSIGSAPDVLSSSAPNVLPPVAAEVPSSGGLPSIPQIANRVTEGIGFLMRNPKSAGLMVGAWVLLLLPAALAYRRRLLLKALTSTGGTS